MEKEATAPRCVHCGVVVRYPATLPEGVVCSICALAEGLAHAIKGARSRKRIRFCSHDRRRPHRLQETES